MIPVFRPIHNGNEKKYLAECIDTGWVSSSGPFVEEFEKEFAKYYGKKYGIAVSSGTAALEVALWSVGVEPGDSVALPDMTIISNYYAVKRLGANPVFVDVDTNGLMDLDQLWKHLEYRKIKAVMPVHLLGRQVDRDELSSLAKDYGFRIVEDCSQAVVSPFDTGCYSLYTNKFVSCGEGGIILTDDERVNERARKYRDLSHTSERFVHVNMGYNFRMGNLQAAVALAKLECIADELERRRRVMSQYLHNCSSLSWMEPVNNDVVYPWMPCFSGKAANIVRFLESKEIEARRLYLPLTRQPVVMRSEKFVYTVPSGGEAIRDKWFYLPCVSYEEVDTVCKALASMHVSMT